MIEKIVGISFNPTNDPEIQVGSPVSIYHDTDNQYSSRAIAVKYKDKLLGHIGEKNNPRHEQIFNVLPLEAKVHTIKTLAEGEEFHTFKPGEITHLEVEFPMDSDEQDGLLSFNERGVVVKFLPGLHKYTYNGKEFISATTYIKKWIKDFDKEIISAMCANSYGCTQDDVLGLWDNGGRISAMYGTVIHNALEHYEKYKKLGQTIQDKKDLPYNRALPSHPVLRDIVIEFLSRFTHKDDHIIPEAFVTNVERGLCGQIDRIKVIDMPKKICRVQDYKINIDSEKENSRNKFLGQMADLPPNKLSKYQLQLSFYARLLELSGWAVEGLDVFVYEDEWKHYPMDVLKLDF